MKKKTTSIFSLSLMAAIAAGLLTGCGTSSSSTSSASATGTRTVTDMAGVEVELPEEVNTYVELWPAHNAFDAMYDGCEGMVMTCANPDGAYYDWLYKICPTISDAEFIQASADMSAEEVLALHPDVVFGSGEDYRQIFEKVGIPYINGSFNTYETMLQSAKLTAEVFGGDAMDIYERYESYYNEKVNFVEDRVSGLSEEDKVSVLHGMTVHDFNIDGADTIIEQWITAAGGINACAADITGNMQTATMEQILIWNPDIIITGDSQDSVDAILNDSAWASITAVQNGNVYVNPRGIFLWDRYGVEGGLQIQWAAKTFYPDLFEDVDMVEEIQEFYSEFLNYDISEEEAGLILAHEDPV